MIHSTLVLSVLARG